MTATCFPSISHVLRPARVANLLLFLAVSAGQAGPVELPAFSFRAAAEDFTNAIHAFLQHRVEVEKRDVGIVVGIVDEHGSSIVSCGKMDNGTDQEVNGDTLFEIGSITKTFTGLLLQDMIERGEMKLDDPVAKYLPKSVRMPTHNGKEITLLQLATHTSGLPDGPDNVAPKRADNRYADYTIEEMYDFLSGYKLTSDPGTKYEYSTVAMALLGQAIALKAGTNYESLVVDRICRPLKMESTRITLTPELESRFAQGHNYYGYAVSHTDFGALMGGAALRSTANDLLKYLSANLGLTPSVLTPLMEKTHTPYFHAGLETDTGLDTDIGLAWMLMHESGGANVIGHGGLTRGSITFTGFDMARRRGVMVLCNSQDFDVPVIGRLLLETEWQSDRRPIEAKINRHIYDSCVGQYKNSLRQAIGAHSQHGVGIRREGDRLFVQITGSRSWPKHVLLPPITDELVPESETGAFERLSGVPIAFSRDARGNVTGLTGHYHGNAFSYEKISDQPPSPEPLKPCVAIKLDTKLLDACVGHYEFAPNATFPTGMKLTIWRQGEQLVGQAWGKDVLQGAFDIYPESEASFFRPIDGAQLTLIKNDKGEVAAVNQHYPGLPGCEGKKLKNE
jgi:CubicO group peptidase (beta-lactamase class C family)